MNERKNKLIVIGQVVVAVIAAFYGFGLVGDAVFAIYLKLNNGIYPPFMPEIVDKVSFYIGGFIAGAIAIFLLFRVKYKVQITLAIIFFICIALVKVRYVGQPVTVEILPYEVILGGGLLVAIYMAVTKYMASNKSSKSTPKGGAI